ncbi:MAG: FecR family protein [Sphingobacteriales bacterium]
MEKEQFLLILTKYLEGNAGPEEENFLYAYYKLFLADAEVMSLLQDKEKEKLKLSIKAGIDAALDRQEPSVRKISLWPRIAAAASILLFLSIGAYFILRKKQSTQQLARNHQYIDIKPGGNKATLILSNGAKIVLTGAKNGNIARQANTIIKKTADGRVVYEANQKVSPAGGDIEGTAYNTMTTPRGGRYEATLADGTRFVLDAGSSIRYPVQFTGKERLVEITGQVYFEVTHDSAHPFIVSVKGQTIEDVGTQFNINAYNDEPVIRTTLIEGSVRVTKSNETAMLRPGQQAVTVPNSNTITIKNADIKEAVAWKNGRISFSNEDIQEIMRQVSRWYDVDIRYEGTIPARQFDGSISRNANLADLLKILEFNNIHFTVSGKKITVRP